MHSDLTLYRGLRVAALVFAALGLALLLIAPFSQGLHPVVCALLGFFALGLAPLCWFAAPVLFDLLAWLDAEDAA